MSYHRLAQRVSAEAAAALVRSGDWLDYGAVLAQPDAFDKALARRIGELRNVSIRICLSTRPRAVVEADPARDHVSFFNWHLGGYDRKQSDEGLQNYIPCNLGEIPDYYRRFIDPPDVMVIKTCPVDAAFDGAIGDSCKYTADTKCGTSSTVQSICPARWCGRRRTTQTVVPRRHRMRRWF